MSAPFVPSVTARTLLLLRGLRYAPLLPLPTVGGTLTVDEAIALFELARALPDEAPRVVEVGGAESRTAFAISRGLVGKRDPRLLCIDRSVDAAAHLARLDADLARTHVRGLVELRQSRGETAAPPRCADVDMLVVTSDLGADAAVKDYLAWTPQLRPGGFLCLCTAARADDDVEKLRRAAQRIGGDPQWVDQRQVANWFLARKSVA